MEIKDPVHGLIKIYDEEIPIVTSNFFNRLRNIKQLGFGEYIYPGATHTRFLHSLGVLHISLLVFDKLFIHQKMTKDLLRIKETFRLACLLHDIGHAPLSHSTEWAMPSIEKLKIPRDFQPDRKKRKATHEDYTLKALADSSFSLSFKRVEDKFGVSRKAIADLISGNEKCPNYFNHSGINYFPILHQLVSGELDCDRMDYLLRDSYFCGVSYGNFDMGWLMENLRVCRIDDRAYLGITERAIITFEDFLLCRYHMFIMVYFHYRAVCLEQLLLKYFQTSEEYQLPFDIEKYLEHDDYHLTRTLRSSKNSYAVSIIKNQIPDKLYESFHEEQHQKLRIIEGFLKDKNLDYIKSSSEGRLSKYHGIVGPHQRYPMKVVRDAQFGKKEEYFEISKATDLFNKFKKANSIMRLHCDLSKMNLKIKKDLFSFISSIN